MEREQALRIIETLLYMTDHPLSLQEIVEVLEIKAFNEEEVGLMVREISDRYIANHSPLQVVDVAGGVQMATLPEMAPWIRKLFKERLTVRLSASALETLSIIAYKQPITKADVELIRGVEASGVIDTLLERRLLKVVGRKETLGRPLLYGTTPEFLRQFGLKHLMDLPDINSIPVSTTTEPQQEFLNMNHANQSTTDTPMASFEAGDATSHSVETLPSESAEQLGAVPSSVDVAVAEPADVAVSVPAAESEVTSTDSSETLENA